MDTVYKQFKDALKREGKYITTYYNSETVKCLFRKNNDNNNIDNHIIIFYEISAPIKQGQLITYSNKQYIVLNQESIENDTYYKSALLECNIVFPVKTNLGVSRIPGYISELSSPGIIKGSIITTQDGTGEILTEVTENTINILINNNTINIIGGYYDVVSQYYRNGISHIIIKRGVKLADSYTFDITTDNTNVETGSSVAISIIAQNNGESVTGQTFTFTSSNESVATVDNKGNVTFLSEGEVTITGVWSEQNLSDAITFIVTNIVTGYTLSISGSSNIYIGGSKKTYIPTLIDKNSQAVTDWTAVWTINYNDTPDTYFIVTYNGNNLLLQVKNDDSLYDYIENPITLTCTTPDNLAIDSIEIQLNA